MKTAEYKIDDYEITEYTDYYRVIEGLRYWEDLNHFGTVWVTQEMYDKYDLSRCSCVETSEELFGEYDEDFNPGREFTYVISIDHCAGVTPLGVDYDEGEWKDGKYINFVLHATQETPHGDCYDEEFVAWWCGFPVELLDEPEQNVQITGWADG
jgi:hypothetical protein